MKGVTEPPSPPYVCPVPSPSLPPARYGGYMSEPEGYDSDIGGGTLRYATVDRRRGPSYEADPMTSSLPR